MANLTKIPAHVAIIPDGNRRWAKERGLPTFEGHRRGFQRIIEVGRKAREMGVKILTIWAFSTENWQRTDKEISYLMKLYEIMINKNLKEALKEKTRIIHLGRKDRINEVLRKKIIHAEQKTKDFDKYYLCIALDYGGKDEVLRAIKNLKRSTFNVQRLTEEDFNKLLDTKNLPQSDVDLTIRTGGEYRWSGLMMWQSAYSEYIFVKKYLPDFSAKDFEECIKEYNQRQRRFGK